MLDILTGSTPCTSTVISQFNMRLVSYVGLGRSLSRCYSTTSERNKLSELRVRYTNIVAQIFFSKYPATISISYMVYTFFSLTQMAVAEITIQDLKLHSVPALTQWVKQLPS